MTTTEYLVPIHNTSSVQVPNVAAPVPPAVVEKIRCSRPSVYSLDELSAHYFNRHSFTLSESDDGTVTAECTCGLVAVGFNQLKDVFDLIVEHCEPL